jgi:hypothetical protein
MRDVLEDEERIRERTERFRKISEFRQKTRFFDKCRFSALQRIEFQAVACYLGKNNSEGGFSGCFGG